MDKIKYFFIAIFVVLAALILVNTIMPPVSTLMLARFMTAQPMERSWMSIERMSPNIVQAVIAAEDGKFCEHHGVDWDALHKSVERAAKKRSARGASTITMQTAKNLFLWYNRSYVRKSLEIPLALFIDVIWSKRQILEAYLNVAEFGPGLFGVEAASQRYFKKSASKLSQYEASLLAATLPNPDARNPARPNGYMLGYASSIRARVGNGVDDSCVRPKH